MKDSFIRSANAAAIVFFLLGVSIVPNNSTQAQSNPLGIYPVSGVFTNAISCLAKDNNGNTYAAGDFMNGNNKFCVAKWDGTSWIELGCTNHATFNNSIFSLTTDASGNVYVAGNFTNANGKRYVAKWNNSSWSELGGTKTSTFNNPIYSVSTDANGNVYAAGSFTNANGRQYVAKWNGTSWR